jgi:hypothetical protein
MGSGTPLSPFLLLEMVPVGGPLLAAMVPRGEPCILGEPTRFPGSEKEPVGGPSGDALVPEGGPRMPAPLSAMAPRMNHAF